jgi:hypothetical protein
MHHSGDRDLGASVAAQMHEVLRALTRPWPDTASSKPEFAESSRFSVCSYPAVGTGPFPLVFLPNGPF